MPARKRGEQLPLVLRGTLFMLRRRCGKPNCHCTTGELHETPALAYPKGGRTGTLTLTGADLDEVRAALGRYEAARSGLDESADAGVAALRAELAAARSRRRS